jgi:hypothetical protein
LLDPSLQCAQFIYDELVKVYTLSIIFCLPRAIYMPVLAQW